MNKPAPGDILLIEDSDADAELTLRTFRKGKLLNTLYRVRDGIEGLKFLVREGAFRELPPDLPKLILMDLNMPTMSGIELLRRIKADLRTASIPVMLLTRSANQHELAVAQQEGALAILAKPVDFAALAHTAAAAGLNWIAIDRTDTPPLHT